MGTNTHDVFRHVTEREQEDEQKRQARPLVRIWDGDWKLIGEVRAESKGKFNYKKNETGIGVLDIPMDNWISQWIADYKNRTGAVHVTMDKSGTRWSGRMEFFKYTGKIGKQPMLTVQFKHDYEELKHLLVWSNPFLPAEVQFPKAWTLFGPSKWVLQLTLLVNLMRRESSVWMLPDDPGDLSEWFDFDQSNWWNVVKPFPFLEDNSNPTTMVARFKTFHDAAKKIARDSQLSIECRRYLKDEDDPPWEGADLRHGCLVWDIVDKSGWAHETSFGGDLLTGLKREYIKIDSDGLTEGIETIEDPNFPDEYYEPGYRGTLPRAPWVVFRDDNYSGIKTTEFTIHPATDVQIVAGGHSQPFINSGIKAAIGGLGNLLGSFIGQGGIGNVVADLTEPLYTDVFGAFQAWKSPQRAAQLGGSHYFERKADDADRAYSLAAILALRAGLWDTRERVGHKFEVVDGANGYWIGEHGHGDFFLSDRVGVACHNFLGDRIYVEQVTELTYEWDPSNPGKWKISVGHLDPEDPGTKLWEEYQDLLDMVKTNGVL